MQNSGMIADWRCSCSEMLMLIRDEITDVKRDEIVMRCNDDAVKTCKKDDMRW